MASKTQEKGYDDNFDALIKCSVLLFVFGLPPIMLVTVMALVPLHSKLFFFIFLNFFIVFIEKEHLKYPQAKDYCTFSLKNKVSLSY